MNSLRRLVLVLSLTAVTSAAACSTGARGPIGSPLRADGTPDCTRSMAGPNGHLVLGGLLLGSAALMVASAGGGESHSLEEGIGEAYKAQAQATLAAALAIPGAVQLVLGAVGRSQVTSCRTAVSHVERQAALGPMPAPVPALTVAQ